MKYLKNIKLQYTYIFFHNFIFAYVIERLYWQSRGMSISHVVYTEIIYALTIIIFEIPTGVLADKWSRRNLIVIGSFFAIVEIVILIYAQTFWHFALAIFIAGISTAMVSGSQNALIYDSLKYHNKENSFEKILGKIRAFDFIAAILAALLGSFIATHFGYTINYWLSLVSMTIAFITTLFMIEPAIHVDLDKDIDTIGYIKRAFTFFKKNNNVALVVLSGMLIGVCMNYIDEFWQIYLNELHIPVIYFGIFGAMTSVSIIPGSIIAYKIRRKLSYKYILTILISTFTISLLVIALLPGVAGIASIILIGFISGITEPLVTGYLHHRTKSEIRATIDSFYSLAYRALSVVVGLTFGYISTHISIFFGYGALGVLCFIYVVLFCFMSKKLNI